MKEPNRDQRPADAAEQGDQIHIIGPLQLQNELLAAALTETTGQPCVCDAEATLEETIELKRGQRGPVLWDCGHESTDALLSRIFHAGSLEDVFLVLFNVSQENKIEDQCVKKGVRGFFYKNENIGIFKKGIHAVLRGEFWVSRKVLSRCLLEKKCSPEFPEEKPSLLTPREKEILAMIASGISKDDIADGLGISPNTVKTHTHNIYQKINVPNRVKAALWANRNLHRRPYGVGAVHGYATMAAAAMPSS